MKSTAKKVNHCESRQGILRDRMSVQLVNDITIESDETPLNDMANLKLGSSCSSCENKTNSLCRCTSLTSGGRGFKDAKKCTLFPYFWRKTLLNPFVKTSKKTKRTRIGGHFEILQPSKLSYISATSQSSSSSSTSPTSTTTTTATNKINTNVTTTTTTIMSLPGNECNPIPQQQQQQLQEQSLNTNIREIILANSTTTASPAFNICTGTFQPSLLLPELPDFTSLSIKGMNEENNIGDSTGKQQQGVLIRDKIGENETTSRLLLGKRTSSQSITELNGAMLNFRLDSRSGSSASKSRSSIKIPRWKSRVKCSYRTKALSPLGPILEDETEPSAAATSSLTSASPSNNNSNFSNCSQQALMENGGRWNQDSSSVDNVDNDITIDELAGYLDQFIYIGSKQMSSMAEMMYT